MTTLSRIALLAPFLTATAGLQALDVYHIGNSLTFQNEQREAFRDAAISVTGEHTMGSHIDLGQNLLIIRGNPDAYEHVGDVGETWDVALNDFTWDAVIAQPYIGGTRTEAIAAGALFSLALDQSEDTACYLYEVWPTREEGEFDSEDWWEARENQHTFDLSEAYFETIRRETEERLDGAAEVRLVPAGSVFEELQRRIESGEITAWDSVLDLYTDHIHLEREGSYIVVATWLSTIYQRPVADFNLTEQYTGINATLAAQLDELVWDVVSTHPTAGVRARSPFVNEMPTELENDMKELDWFGPYYDEPFPYVYSSRLGWVYVMGSDPNNFYVYSWTYETWLWIGKTYFAGNWVYNFSTQQWDMLNY